MSTNDTLTFPPESPRHAAAAHLISHGASLFEAIATQSDLPGAVVRSALIQGRRAGLFCQDARDKRWQLTVHGRHCWERQLEALAATPETGARVETYACNQSLMTGAGYTRFMGTGDRLPQVLRPGAMDFAKHPRITGPYRVWPDGRRERIDAANDAGQEAA